jgi:hypothetical protein
MEPIPRNEPAFVQGVYAACIVTTSKGVKGHE